MNGIIRKATTLSIYMEHGFSGIRQQYIRPHHFDLIATDGDGITIGQKVILVNGSSSLVGDESDLSEDGNGDIVAFVDRYFEQGKVTTLVASDLPSLMRYLEVDGRTVLTRMPKGNRIDINTLVALLPPGTAPFVAGYIQGYDDFVDARTLVKVFMDFRTTFADSDNVLSDIF
ncbi:MAG: hypothetical protein JWN28_670 [Candidatus Saccharibacteria bacterium]|nr:hypothetical protein [Candidatus Saccharibacteria bacterium]